jgi:hypothetical protein
VATQHESASFSYHGETDGTDLDDITLNEPYKYVDVMSWGGADLTFQLAAGDEDTLPELVALGEGTYVIPSGGGLMRVQDDGASRTGNLKSRVQVLSESPVKYSIYGSDMK